MKTKKMNLYKLGLLFLSINLAMMSCKKDEETPAESDPTPQEEVQNYPTPADADGVLVAIKSTSITDTPIGPIETILGTAVGIFTDDNFGSFISAGTVECNSSALDINPNNSYVFTDISVTNPTGLDFSSNVQWDVTGGNGIPSISYDANSLGFPSVGAITSADEVDKADGYTLTCASVSGADSVLFLVGGAAKTIVGNATSCTFTTEELSDVSAGSNVVQVAAYVMNSTVFSSKNIYFINESVQTQSVTVQ